MFCYYPGEKPNLEVLESEVFRNDLIYLMSGLESSTFGYDVSSASFVMRRQCVVENISYEALQSYTRRFIQVFDAFELI